jgi:poly(3-hydroxyalkanoate) synthetase
MWPFTAAKLALDASFWWLDGASGRPDRSNETPLPWTTPNSIVLELSSMRLRDFSRQATGQPVLVCVPYALHGALIADFASGHSVVEALQTGGLGRVYLTDWRSAEPDMRYLSIDNYLSDLNVAVDEIGAPVDLVGLCQGGWLSLIYAARFPKKVRRLVLVGAPVDVSVPSDLSRMVANVPRAVLDEWVDRAGGIVSGKRMLSVWSPSFSSHDVELVLQRDLASQATELLHRFERWNTDTLDLPGTYYLQVTNWIFRENRIAEGRFVALGREIKLADVKAPVLLLAGSEDELVPPDQAFATARLLGAPSTLVETAIEACTHLGLFMGCKALSNSWRRIVRWLESDLTDGGRSRNESPPDRMVNSGEAGQYL